MNLVEPADGTAEARRRLAPRIIDTDWLVLRAMRRVLERLAREVGRPGATALDFGCGVRPYAPLFAAHGCSYVGADLGEGAEVAIGADGRLAAADASADLVLSFQVLEHVRDLETYFAEAHRVLRADGSLILSTHGTWLYHPHPEDHRRWTRTGLIGEIERNGFEVLGVDSLVGPLAWTTMIRLTSLCFVLRKLPLFGGALGALAAAAMNARAWIEEQITPRSVTADNACVYVVLCRRSAPAR